MPEYLYEHPKTGAIISVIQRVNEAHVYIKRGVTYRRVFTVPQASVDTKINPHNAKDFVNKTRNKKGTIGDLYDQSAELSEKRKKSLGYDPIKNKYFADYAKKRGGKQHPDSFKD